MCLTAYSPADLADYADECSRAALFRRQKTVSANVSAKADAADNAEKDSYHIVECCSCLYNKSVREHACSFLVLSLPFPYSFLVLSFLARSLLVPYVFNGRFSRRSRRLRRQKTVSANESAKADAADNRRERQLPHSGNNTVHAVCCFSAI